MALKTNYKDDVLDLSVNTNKKYNQVTNADGTISLEDVTTYTQEGDNFGANDVNAITTEVNSLSDSLTANGNGFFFDYQDGKYGFNTSSTRGADTFQPFLNGIKTEQIDWVTSNNWSGVKTLEHEPSYLLFWVGTSQNLCFYDAINHRPIINNFIISVDGKNVSINAYHTAQQTDHLLSLYV